VAIIDKKLEEYAPEKKCRLFDEYYAEGGIRLTSKEPPFEKLKPPFSNEQKCASFDNLYMMAKLLYHNHHMRDV